MSFATTQSLQLKSVDITGIFPVGSIDIFSRFVQALEQIRLFFNMILVIVYDETGVYESHLHFLWGCKGA